MLILYSTLNSLVVLTLALPILYVHSFCVNLVGEALFAERNSSSRVHNVSLACNGSETSPSQCGFVNNPQCSSSNQLARLRCREGKNDVHNRSNNIDLLY